MNAGTIASSRLSRVLPFVRWCPMVNRSTLKADLVAGFTGSILGLPQGVAFAILAGLPPQYGLYAAMIPPALASLFGSSWHMIAGPTQRGGDPALRKPRSPRFTRQCRLQVS